MEIKRFSNLIYYRVAYIRQDKGNTIPYGHIHMGFNKVDPHGTETDNRTKMLEAVIEMLKKFNDIL